MGFTNNDYDVLKSIINRDNRTKGLSKVNGTTVKEITEKTSLCDKKVRQSLKKFEEVGFICKAIKKGRAESFMLTEEGFIELNNLNKNIFGEVAK